MLPMQGIGTDPDHTIANAMNTYGTAYTTYWTALEDSLIAGAGTLVQLYKSSQ